MRERAAGVAREIVMIETLDALVTLALNVLALLGAGG